MDYKNRKFELVSSRSREAVDLQLNKDEIINAVHEVAPDAKVIVRKKYYVVNRITISQIIKIGRKLAQSRLAVYSENVPRLFTGSEADLNLFKEDRNHGTRKLQNVYKRK